MTRNVPITFSAALATATLLTLAACDNSAPTTDTTDPSAGTGQPTWVLAAAPADAISITDAKANAAEGDTIVLRGIIGGEVKPMSADSPVLRVVDSGLFNRCTAEADHCSTPWDYCCADPADLVANSATIQIVDADGNAISGGPSVGGLEPLDEIVVVGTVAPRPSSDVLIVKANGVHRIGG